MLIESLSGVRGHETDLNFNVVQSYGYAFSEECAHGKILIGRDTRQSGIYIRKMIVDALLNSGAELIDLGICPTPTVQFEVEHLKASGGIVITASHNPLPWNGLKFVGSDGLFLDREQMESLQKRRTEIGKNLPAMKFVKSAPESYKNAIEDHIELVLNLPYVDIDRISKRKFKIIVDTVNGAAFRAVPELLSRLGCTVIPIHSDGDKPFPHTPEPLPENLTDLMAKVKSEKADLGFAIDPDGDRLAIISDEGLPISEENTLVLASMCVLSKTKDRRKIIVTNLSTTMAIDDIAQRFGAAIIRTPIGEINVAKKMREVQACIGGEGNGGVILPEAHLGRDSLVGSALVLQFLSEQNGPLSEVMKSIPKYSMIKKKAPRGTKPLIGYLDNLKRLASPEAVNTDDGVKFIWKDRWVHMRPSNTEPIIRIYAEAPTIAEAEETAQPFIDFFQQLV